MELALDKPKYYVALCAPVIRHTMGGVKTNTLTEDVKEGKSAIPGLFAAGNNGDIIVEVTVEGGNIVFVVLKEHGETAEISNKNMSKKCQNDCHSFAVVIKFFQNVL